MAGKTSTSTPVRVEADLYEAAKSAGASSSRSAAQQVDYWARLGRAVSMVESAARRRIEAAVAGELPLAELSGEERIVANAEIDATVEQLAQSTSYGARLACEGVTTVALDEDGRLVEYRPDGSTAIVG